MRIGIDGRLWNETGVGRYIRNLVWGLQELDKKNDYLLFVKKGFKSHNLRLNNERWKIVETDIHWHSLAEQIKFPQILYKENLDLMHFPYFSLPIFYNKPFVVTIHDLIINHFPTGKASTLPYPLYLMKRIGYNSVMNHAIKNSNKIIVPLNAVKDDVLEMFDIPEEKIVVTYEGVEFANRRTIKTGGDGLKYFLYVGNAYPHKNLDVLVDAFLEFKKIIKEDIKLILVGKNDYFYKILKTRIEREKIADVIFKHDVNDEELFSLYSKAEAFISTSLMEGFGLPPLEAMSVSCPVMLSDIPSFREVCSDAAFYFDPISTNSIKDCLSLVYNLDQQTKEKYITKGLERVNKFSWDKMSKETLAIYESSISLRQS